MKYLRTGLFIAITFQFILSITTPAQAKTIVAGDSSGTFTTSLSGSAQYQIPLPTPPGVNAHEPRLTLQYSSGSGDSQLGVGWRLSGLSSISRCSQTPAVDGVKGTIHYDNNDRYCVDGQRLIVVAGQYGEPTSQYRTELETWRLFTASSDQCGSGPCSFSVSMRDGSTVRYGASDDSRVLARTASGESRDVVRVWSITDTEDTQGNRLSFKYSLQPDGVGQTSYGQNYPTAIHYGGHVNEAGVVDQEHNRHVHFTWEERDDIHIAWVGAGPVVTAARLKNLTTSVDYDGNELIAHQYRIDYEYSPTTQRSLVKQIQTCSDNSDTATCLPADQFQWQGDARVAFTPQDIAPADPLSTTYRQILPGDVNADGLGDLIYIRQSTTSQNEILPLLSDGQTLVACDTPSTVSVKNNDRFLVGDTTGDGALDLIHLYPNGAYTRIDVYPGTPGSCLFKPPFSTDTTAVGLPTYSWPTDANGDGKVDIVFGQTSSAQVTLIPYFSNGDGFDAGQQNNISKPENQSIFPMDVNGDGMIDMVQSYATGSGRLYFDTWIADGTGYQSGASSNFPYPANTVGIWPMDANGDGMSDLVLGWLAGGTILHLQLYFADGISRFNPGSDTDTGTGANNALAFWPMDVNGDGRIDFTQAFRSSSGVSLAVYQNHDDGFSQGEIVGSDLNAVASNTIWPIDFTGTGKMDLVQTWGTSGPLQFAGYLNQGVRPDFINEFQNSLGGLTRVNYKPLSDPSVYHADYSAVTLPDDHSLVPAKSYLYRAAPALAPYQRVGGSVRLVVADTTELNDPTINPAKYEDRTEYFYSNGAVNLNGRGWLGFRRIDQTDVGSGLQKSTWLNQAFPLTGTIDQLQYNCIDSLSSDPLCTDESTLLSEAQTQYLTKEIAQGSGANQATIYEVVKDQEVMGFYHYGAINFYRGAEYQYDDWGNPTLISDLGYVNADGQDLDPKDNLYTCNGFQNDIGDQSWALGYHIDKKISASIDCFDFNTFLSGVDFHLEHWQFDEDYNNTLYSIYDNSNDVYLSTQYIPDEFGNITDTILPGNRITQTVFDSVYHNFPTQLIQPPNEQGVQLSEYFTYDPRYGTRAAYQTSSVAGDENRQGQIYTSCFDALGRTVVNQGPLPSNIQGVISDANCVSSSLTSSPIAFAQANVITQSKMAYVSEQAGESGYVFNQELQNWPTSTSPATFRDGRSYFDGKRRLYMVLNEAGSATPTPGGWLASCTQFDTRNKVIATLLPSYTQAVLDCGPEQLPSLPTDSMTLDAYARPTQRITPMSAGKSSITTIRYDDQLNQCTTRAAGTPEAYERCTQYDYFASQREVTSLVVLSDNNATTSYEYDRTGRLKQVTSPMDPVSKNVVINTMSYDSVGRRLTQDNPDQNSTGDPNIDALSLAYSPQTGLLSTATDALQRITQYQFDKLGRVTKKTFSDQSYVHFTYDDESRQSPNSLGLLSLEQGYDSQGMPAYSQWSGYDKYSRSTRKELSYGTEQETYLSQSVLDPLGQIIQRQFPNAVSYSALYDMGDMTQVNAPDISAEFAQYSPFGQAGSWNYQVVKGARAYDYLGHLISRKTEDGSGQTVVNLNLSWSPLFLLDEISDQLQLGVDLSQDFNYRSRRLIQADAPGLYGKRSYEYDVLGNLRNINSGQLKYQWHRVESGTIDDGLAFSASYDDVGNIQQRDYGDQQWHFEYDPRNRLTQVKRNGAVQSETPLYDDAGRRLSKLTPDGQEVRYISKDYEVTLMPGGDELRTYYVMGAIGTIAAVTTSTSAQQEDEGIPDPGTLYFESDHLNSTSLAFTEAGKISSTRSYLPYGLVYAEGSSGPENFRPLYQNKEFDAGSELYYFNARYYDPLVGRFLTADTGTGSHLYEQDTLNRYEFGLGAPSTFTDPSGNSIWDSIAGVSIGVLEIAAGVAIDIISDGALESVGGALIGAGFNGVTYSATHSGNFSWKQYGIQEAEGAVIGLVTAGIGEMFAPAEEVGAEAIADGIESTGTSAAAEATSDAIESAAGEELESSAADLSELGSDSGGNISTEASDAGSDSFSGDDEVCPLSLDGDTLVWLSEGQMPIADLALDMEVLSRNSLDGSHISLPINRTLSRDNAQILQITLMGDSGESDQLLITPRHPVATVKHGWLAAEELQLGDELLSYDHGAVYVDDIQTLSGQHSVFNISVAPYRSYYVGEFGIWVHNPCRTKTKKGKVGNKQYDIILEMPESEYPESAQHIADAQKAGQPKVLRVKRAIAKSNRRKSLRGIKTELGKDRDEYPPAMFEEGGTGASVRHITSADNRASGSSFGGQLRSFPDGTRVWFRIVKK